MIEFIDLIVYRDADSNVINIGEWEYFYYEEDGVMIAANPLPNGVTSKVETVQINKDGSRTVVT